jgi:hypothetical protein
MTILQVAARYSNVRVGELREKPGHGLGLYHDVGVAENQAVCLGQLRQQVHPNCLAGTLGRYDDVNTICKLFQYGSRTVAPSVDVDQQLEVWKSVLHREHVEGFLPNHPLFVKGADA